MFNIMYSRYILTIAAIFVILMVDVIYFSKPKISKRVKHKLFSWLIIVNTVMLFSELVIMVMFGIDMPFEQCVILLQIRDICLILYFSCILFYYYSTINDMHYTSIGDLLKGETFLSKRKTLLPHFIFTVCVLIIHFFLPYNYATKETYNLAFSGPAFYFTILYCVLSTLETLYIILFVNRKKINYAEKLSMLWLFGLMLVILVFQVLANKVAIMGLISSVYILVLYFIFENPDLEVVEEIDNLTSEIERANSSKLDFLSKVSKEMISPMNAIAILSESILTNPDDDPKKLYDDIKQIELSSKNFLEIINNTLDISNVDSENDKLSEKDYSLMTLLNNVIDTVKEKTISNKVKIVMKIDNSIPNYLFGDPMKIQQVLLNVISNSIKYTEVGRITISLSKEIKNSQIILKFKISDTGFGIKPEDHDKIFQRYSRLEEAVSRGIEGTGLGLAIAKNYVDLLGGKIWFDSVYGAGTTFYMDIPQKIVDSDSTLGDYKEAEDKDEDKDMLLDCSKYRILIVEDDALNLEVTSRLFGRYGFKIDTCSNGNDCIFKYKKGEHYDMILIDHIMPEMSGIEVMQVIKKLKDYKAPPLIALTANTYTGSKDVFLQEGFDDYLAKPIDMIELDSLVNRYFK